MNRKIFYFLSLLILSFYFESRGTIARATAQVQFIEANRKLPVADANVAFILEVDKSQVDSTSLKSNPQGIVDISEFLEKNQAVLEKYKGRATLTVIVDERTVNLPVDQIGTKGPLRVQIDLGEVLVKGFFTKEAGTIPLT